MLHLWPSQDTANLIVFYVTNLHVRPWLRRRLSRAYVWLFNRLFGTSPTRTAPTCSGRRSFAACPFRADGFTYQTEAVVKAVRSWTDFIQLGIEIKTRESGRSKAVSWRNFRNVAVRWPASGGK